MSAALSFAQVAKAQETDREIQQYMLPGSALNLVPTPLPDNDVTLWCEKSTVQPRPFLPLAFRRAAFEQLHNLAHPGVKPTVRLVAARFFGRRRRKTAQIGPKRASSASFPKCTSTRMHP
jgi:hypothetical protein